MSLENRQPDSTDNPGPSPLVIRSAILPLFSVGNVRVQLHAALLVSLTLVLLLGPRSDSSNQDRIEAAAVLVAIILVRESVRCAVACGLNCKSKELLLSPFGGPVRPNAVDGPLRVATPIVASMLANAILCAAALMVIRSVDHTRTWNPYALIHGGGAFPGWLNISYHARWVYAVGSLLLGIGLLPIYPLDLGRVLHAVLATRIGFAPATLLVSASGITGSVVLLVVGGSLRNWEILCAAACCFSECLCLRWMYHQSADEIDVASGETGSRPRRRRRRRLSRRAILKLRRRAQRDAMEIRHLDAALCKVSREGLHALTWSERRVLRRATQRQREFDEDMEDRPAIQ